MSNHYSSSLTKDQWNSLSIEAVLVGTVFFLVLSQFLIMKVDNVTQIFRPIIVFSLYVQMVRRGHIPLACRRVAFLLAVYEVFVYLFNFGNGDSVKDYLATSLYFLLFYTVTGFPWNRIELRTIIFLTFLGTIACVAVFVYSNDMTNINSGAQYMLGVEVNRNKNAYAFSLGVVLAIIYIIQSKGIVKTLAVLSLPFLAYCLLYSQCRGAFLSAAVSVIIITLIELGKIKKRNVGRFWCCLILLVVLCVVCYGLIKNSDFSRLVDRENTSGRDDGIEHAFQLFMQSDPLKKIFGNGTGFEARHTNGAGAHLVYMSYLLQSGIVGSFMVALLFIKAGCHMRSKSAIPLFALAFLRTFAEGLDYYIYIPLILSVCCNNYEIRFSKRSKDLFVFV